jgi:hypothetical protein
MPKPITQNIRYGRVYIGRWMLTNPKERLRGISVETITIACLSRPSKPSMISSRLDTRRVPNPIVNPQVAHRLSPLVPLLIWKAAKRHVPSKRIRSRMVIFLTG